MAKKDPSATDGQGAGTGRLKLIVLIVLALLLAVGLSIGGTWFILSKKGGAEEKGAQVASGASAALRQPALYQELAPAFVANFTHEGRARYLQVSIALMGRDSTGMEALKLHMPVLRNRLVMLLSSQDFAVLQTPLGKEMLQQQALASVQELAQKETGSAVVDQLLFTNFVLQ